MLLFIRLSQSVVSGLIFFLCNTNLADSTPARQPQDADVQPTTLSKPFACSLSSSKCDISHDFELQKRVTGRHKFKFGASNRPREILGYNDWTISWAGSHIHPIIRRDDSEQRDYSVQAIRLADKRFELRISWHLSLTIIVASRALLWVADFATASRPTLESVSKVFGHQDSSSHILEYADPIADTRISPPEWLTGKDLSGYVNEGWFGPDYHPWACIWVPKASDPSPDPASPELVDGMQQMIRNILKIPNLPIIVKVFDEGRNSKRAYFQYEPLFSTYIDDTCEWQAIGKSRLLLYPDPRPRQEDEWRTYPEQRGENLFKPIEQSLDWDKPDEKHDIPTWDDPEPNWWTQLETMEMITAQLSEGNQPQADPQGDSEVVYISPDDDTPQYRQLAKRETSTSTTESMTMSKLPESCVSKIKTRLSDASKTVSQTTTPETSSESPPETTSTDLPSDTQQDSPKYTPIMTTKLAKPEPSVMLKPQQACYYYTSDGIDTFWVPKIEKVDFKTEALEKELKKVCASVEGFTTNHPKASIFWRQKMGQEACVLGAFEKAGGPKFDQCHPSLPIYH